MRFFHLLLPLVMMSSGNPNWVGARRRGRGWRNCTARAARSVGQNAQTSVIYGMPRAAYELGAVDRQLPIGEITSAINAAVDAHGEDHPATVLLRPDQACLKDTEVQPFA